MKTINLVETLKTFGISAAPYKRSPVGKDTFLIAILSKKKNPEGIIQVNQGLAEIEVHGSKKHRQAVISVTEKPRVVTHKVTLDSYRHIKSDDKQAKQNLQDNFPVLMPGTPIWSYSGIKIEKAKNSVNEKWKITGVVTAKVGKTTTNHFLVGVDESHNFIAPLPKKANSVEEAHHILKPKLRAGSLRQGEWYFEPLTKKEDSEIQKIALEGKRVKETRLGASTHRAQSTVTIVIPGKGKGKKRVAGTKIMYARGFITDNRKGHHQSLFLPKWHKVVRNREIAPKRNASAWRRSWD